MKKLLGIFGLLLAVCLFATWASESFRSGYNIENLIRRTALFGVIGIGVTFVIVTGGIVHVLAAAAGRLWTFSKGPHHAD
jgi:ribose transport system permease protein